MPKTPVRESEIKNRLKSDYFAAYDWTRVIGDIDLAVCSKPRPGALPVTYLWMETKKGRGADIYESLVQLVLTVGKARTYEREMPPYLLGAADAEKVAFVEYAKVMQVFAKTDFNWNVTPSDHGTREFKELYALLHDQLERDVAIFKYAYDDRALREYIKVNFVEGREDATRIPVTKNNFTFVYWDWVRSVRDSVAVDWKKMEKAGVLDSDFFLADLMSNDDVTIKDALHVILEKTKYRIRRGVEADGLFSFSEIPFKDGQRAYRQFWNRYERPPKAVYQKYILERRDLLVPQDIREVRGSYYTPEVWVRLAQEYIARALGEDWQEEYVVWDCAAGTGNLLRGLTNKYNVYASTLDDADVKIMHTAIDEGRLNLVKSNVFQFDFLNDDFSKLPESLRRVVEDPERRKKLCVFINPPYKEATNARTITGTAKHNAGSTSNTKVNAKYATIVGSAINEMFAQFTIRIAKEMAGCVLAEFSTLKILQAPNFKAFRGVMGMEIKSLFLVPGNTFENVDGDFPVAFQIYKTDVSSDFEEIVANVYEIADKVTATCVQNKTIVNYDKKSLISKFISDIYNSKFGTLSFVRHNSCDFQQQNRIIIEQNYNGDDGHYKPFSEDALLLVTVYYAVRKIPQATWLNDRDQFLAPKASWAADATFQADCLVWSIFNNAVRSSDGVCHWIPYYEDEVDAVGPFNSRFMADFLHGKIGRKTPEASFGDLFDDVEAQEATVKAPLEAASPEALAVLDKGREIWRYYMRQPGAEANASYLDIRAFFQGYRTTSRGKRIMNSSSEDATYQRLLTEMRALIKALEAVIEPKIYEYGFLLR